MDSGKTQFIVDEFSGIPPEKPHKTTYPDVSGTFTPSDVGHIRILLPDGSIKVIRGNRNYRRAFAKQNKLRKL